MKTNCLTRQVTLSIAALAALCGLSLSCTKTVIDDNEQNNEEPPAPELENQIEYNGGEWEMIFSSIYEVSEDDVYTFYLSPEENVSSVIGMLEKGNALIVNVASPDGEVDTAVDDFEISYGELNVSKDDMADVKALALSVTFDEQTSVLTLSLDLTMTDGTTLKAAFERACTVAALVELADQYEFNNTLTSIGSAVAWKSRIENTTAYYLYEEAGHTEPAGDTEPADIMIDIAADLVLSSLDNATPVDIASAVTEGKLRITGPDGFSTEDATSVTGTLTIAETTLSNLNILNVSLDVTVDGKRLRAEYAKVYSYGYEAANTFTVTENINDTDQPTVNATDLTKVFVYNNEGSGVSQRIFMLGNAADPQTPADLKEKDVTEDGKIKYAVKLTVGNEGTSFSGDNFDIALYNYDTYITTDRNTAGFRGVEGDIYVDNVGDKTYLYFNIAFVSQNNVNTRVTVEGEWYGDLTVSDENTDLVPVRPFTPIITIIQGGTALFSAEIERVEMRQHNSYSFQGSPAADYYFFYFVPKDTEISSVASDRQNVPMLMVPVSTAKGEDVVIGNDKSIYWNFKYQKTGLQVSEYYRNSWGSLSPDDATVNIIRNDDKTWNVKFSTTDSYLSFGNPAGSGNKLLIEWQGPLTKYSGTETNNYPESDY